ncbi:MAG: UDP-N-acetylglucosamine 4,6-dehydratase (inverting) [Acetobacterales bacterium]
MIREFLDDKAAMNLDGSSILVTGGTGSFGREFTLQVLKRFNPRRLIIFSRDELKQWEMQQDPRFAEHDCVRFFIGDVRDAERVRMAMRDVDYVVHAAAMKQVPTAEYNPFECIRTNIYGAEAVATAAMQAGVKRVIALSTDKAASPINLYGASKLASDKIFIAANNMSGRGGTRFSVVRYGNVMGSRGSVVSIFRKLIAENTGVLPITDPRMTRFFIEIRQGSAFVLSCLDKMEGGEVFVPKIPSVRIGDLARWMAPDFEQKIVGIRPGEKLHETLIGEYEARTTLDMGDRYVIQPALSWWKGNRYQDEGNRAVDDSFVYSSDSNEEWLSEIDMRRMLGRLYDVPVAA